MRKIMEDLKNEKALKKIVESTIVTIDESVSEFYIIKHLLRSFLNNSDANVDLKTKNEFVKENNISLKCEIEYLIKNLNTIKNWKK